jgi:hypothetical protein
MKGRDKKMITIANYKEKLMEYKGVITWAACRQNIQALHRKILNENQFRKKEATDDVIQLWLTLTILCALDRTESELGDLGPNPKITDFFMLENVGPPLSEYFEGRFSHKTVAELSLKPEEVARIPRALEILLKETQ